MWYISLLLGFAFTGVAMSNPQADIEKCVADLNLENMEELLTLHEGAHLELLCPMVLGFMDCLDDAIVRATGFKIAELAAITQQPEMVRAAGVFENVRGVFTDLCTNNTELNQAYRRNAVCLESMNVDPEACTERAVAAFEAYKEFEDKVQEEAGENTRNDNGRCMVEAYKSACYAAEIHDTCGKESFELYQTMVKRTTVFRNLICSEEDLEEIKNGFLDSLSVEEERKDLFRLAFDLRRRRK